MSGTWVASYLSCSLYYRTTYVFAFKMNLQIVGLLEPCETEIWGFELLKTTLTAWQSWQSPWNAIWTDFSTIILWTYFKEDGHSIWNLPTRMVPLWNTLEMFSHFTERTWIVKRILKHNFVIHNETEWYITGRTISSQMPQTDIRTPWSVQRLLNYCVILDSNELNVINVLVPVNSRILLSTLIRYHMPSTACFVRLNDQTFPA